MKEKFYTYTRRLFQGTFVPLTGNQVSSNVNLAPFFSNAFQSGNLADFFNAAFQAAIAIGAILAVLRIAYAGFLYMTTDIWSQKEKAKIVLQQTILGLLLLSGIWLILYQINPNLLNLDILQNVSPVPTAGGGGAGAGGGAGGAGGGAGGAGAGPSGGLNLPSNAFTNPNGTSPFFDPGGTPSGP